MRILHVSCDAAGNVSDAALSGVADEMPGTDQFLVLSHGWRETDAGAAAWFDAMTPGMAERLDDNVLCVCLHWPSDDVWGELSYYKMERRAALIGRTAAYRLASVAISEAHHPVRVHFAGHSDGGIVSVNALAEVAAEGSWHEGDTFALTLIEPACPANYLESGQPGGPCLATYPNVGITLSRLDKALSIGFPAAERLEFRNDCSALGYAGPTDRTRHDLGELLKLIDLTAAHEANPSFGPDHHCDVFRPEVWDLLARK